MNSVDKEIGRLVEELEKRDEPSILIFFGDHYPTFGNNNQVYGSQGTQIANNMLGDYDDFINTHNVPYFIWKSEGNEPKELDLSPNQFGAIALEMAGVKGNTVTAILDDMRAKGDAVIPYNQWQKQMGAQTEEMGDLHQMQFDLLHGKRHVEKTIPGLIGKPADDYHLGLYPEMDVRKITDNGNSFEILTKGVPKFTKILSENDEELVAEWNELGNGLSAFTVNKSDIEAGEKFRFALYDSLENILRNTDYFEIAETP